MIKESTNQKEIRTANIRTPSARAPNYKETDSNATLAVDFSTQLSAIDRLARRKI